MIKRVNVENDARLKKIILTDYSLACHEIIRAKFESIDEELTEGVSEEELQIFYQVAHKIKLNIEKRV